MKRILSFAMVLCLALMLGGCGGGGAPKGVSEDTYDTAVLMVDVVDQYLDLKIEAKEAKSKIDQLMQRLGKTEDHPESEKSILSAARLIEAQIISASLPSGEKGSKDTEIKKSRNQLAEYINLKQR